jgi:hypothetical protein
MKIAAMPAMSATAPSAVVATAYAIVVGASYGRRRRRQPSLVGS